MDEKKLYVFRGHVMKFDKPYQHSCRYQTMAVSKAQAQSNIKKQIRNKYGLIDSTPLTLIGEFTIEEKNNGQT